MGEIIRQKFNLYNTVGFIDKDKNIYFVPHQADIFDKVSTSQTKVCDCYYELFNEVSPFSSKYHDIDIDQWSPEDRSLVVDGIIDDFRQSRGRGLALNYMIVTRSIYEDDGETETLVNKYYQAFFIDSVEQSGSRSVRLNITPDYFTNFFYLNNNDTLTEDYDPFNPVMKNCFIERQHYDRFTVVNNKLAYTNLKKILGSEESFKFKYQYKDKRLFLPLGKNININDYEELIEDLKFIDTLEEFKEFISGLSSDNKNIVSQIFISYLNVIFKENYLLPNSYNQSGNNMYYKAGFNTYKGVSVPFVHCALPFVSIPKGLENIQKSWIKLAFYVDSMGAFEDRRYTKIYDVVGDDNYSPSRVLDYLSDIGASQYILTTYVSKYSTLNKDIFSITEETDNIRINFGVDIKQKNSTLVTNGETAGEGNKTVALASNTIAFLPVAYDEGSGVGKHKVIDTGRGVYQVSADSISSFYTITAGIVSITSNVFYYTSSQKTYMSLDFRTLIFVLGDSELYDFRLVMKDREPTISYYYEPLLESDPYSFFSISINESEQIISKSKLIESYSGLNNTFTFKLLPIMSYNDSYKVGLIPSFYFNSNWQRYYNDAIVIIISTQVPIIEDSWLTYYVTNKAQMKNQYAVQYNNYDSGMIQGSVQGIADVGIGAVKGGETGATKGMVSGAIKGLTGLINTTVSNAYQIANIKLTQQAKLADMGAKPDTVKFAGSDILYDMIQNERGFYLNYYRIDDISYDSACKYLERFGYLVNIFDVINPFNRIGLNYVKITSFDFVEDEFVLSQEQMNAVSSIFEEGVTLLHDHDYLHYLGEYGHHNFETVFANYSPVTPQLSTPSISISGDTLTITAVSNAQNYKIYADGVLVDTIATTTLDLRNLNLSVGNHIIKVKAIATGYIDSDFSNSVSYVVPQPTGGTVTLTVTEIRPYLADAFKVYDGQDDTGTLLYSMGGSLIGTQVLNCQSGYLFIEAEGPSTMYVYGIGTSSNIRYQDAGSEEGDEKMLFTINGDGTITMEINWDS